MAVTAAGWLAIVAGAAVTVLGLSLFGAIFSGRGVPVGGAGLFLVLTWGAGPVLTLAGLAAVIAGFKLMGGYLWARTALEFFSWFLLCASIGWLIYRASHVRHLHSIHVIQGALFFLITGVPALALILLLRSTGVERSITR